MLTKDNVTIGIEWRFGPDWPGQRCGAKTRRGTACQRPANEVYSDEAEYESDEQAFNIFQIEIDRGLEALRSKY
jgi:hypothetical protein